MRVAPRGLAAGDSARCACRLIAPPPPAMPKPPTPDAASRLQAIVHRAWAGQHAQAANLSSEALNGSWRLRARDRAATDTGYINSWSITF